MPPRLKSSDEDRKARNREAARSRREYIKSIGKEEYERQQEYKRWDREQAKREREEKRILRANLKREKAVLTFMKKNDVMYHHHGRKESMMDEIKSALGKIKEGEYQEYDPYIWNRQGEGNNYLPLCQFGNIFSGTSEFETIYDVPLDGTYKFYIYDSGERGLGSFNRITAKKVEQETKVPYVHSGS